MQPKAKRAPALQAPKQTAPDALAHHTATTLAARLGELREHLEHVVAEVVRLERANIIAPELDDERTHDTRKAGLALAAGGNEPLALVFELQDVHRRLALLRRLSRDLHAAIDVAEARVNILSIAEQGERWNAARPQYRERVREVWKALVALDMAQAARDKFIRDLRVRADVEAGPGWVMVGRLAHTESQAYRYGRVLVDIGALSESEFQRDYEAAKQRDPRHNDKA